MKTIRIKKVDVFLAIGAVLHPEYDNTRRSIGFRGGMVAIVEGIYHYLMIY